MWAAAVSMAAMVPPICDAEALGVGRVVSGLPDRRVQRSCIAAGRPAGIAVETKILGFSHDGSASRFHQTPVVVIVVHGRLLVVVVVMVVMLVVHSVVLSLVAWLSLSLFVMWWLP